VEERLIISGFGGQGVMTIGKFAASLAMDDGREVTFFPSYGAEVRGGTAHCHLIVSDEPIISPLVEEADSLIVMNQLSYDRFRPLLRAGGLLVLNSSLAEIDPAKEKAGAERVAVPATEIANEMGNVRVANVIIFGAYCARRKLLDPDRVLAGIDTVLSERKHLQEINRLAFQKGMELAAKGR
jgi:2-oxoglutarate ferredoxin oxidoreductase subunit gamma